MEHVHATPVTGRVKALNVVVGDQVTAHRVIVEIEETMAEAEVS
jgi:geranyl-CoA carboxylase alpha subunit